MGHKVNVGHAVNGLNVGHGVNDVKELYANVLYDVPDAYVNTIPQNFFKISIYRFGYTYCAIPMIIAAFRVFLVLRIP